MLIIGAGASGLMCGIHAGYNGHSVLILEKGRKAGAKIIISGGGRCNFTNILADPRKHYQSQNPHFCISALKRFTPDDFVAMVERHGIAYHEKKLGQQFCDGTSQEILQMLLTECEWAGVKIHYNQDVLHLERLDDGGFAVETTDERYLARKVVLACGGLSIPKIASDLAFRTAGELGLKVASPRAALVPFTWNSGDKVIFEALSGISLDAIARCNGISFRENILFTHRGLSGPAILQISSYWREGDTVHLNLLPEKDAVEWLAGLREQNPQQRLTPLLKNVLPNRFVDVIIGQWFEDRKLGAFSPDELKTVARSLNDWQFRPGGTEGYRTAEVTLGGIHTDELSSKTFECRRIPGLHVIGEAVDVTGWLGGYNFQWAWASAWCCAQHL